MNGHTLKVAAFYGDFADTQMAQVHILLFMGMLLCYCSDFTSWDPERATRAYSCEKVEARPQPLIVGQPKLAP